MTKPTDTFFFGTPLKVEKRVIGSTGWELYNSVSNVSEQKINAKYKSPNPAVSNGNVDEKKNIVWVRERWFFLTKTRKKRLFYFSRSLQRWNSKITSFNKLNLISWKGKIMKENIIKTTKEETKFIFYQYTVFEKLYPIMSNLFLRYFRVLLEQRRFQKETFNLVSGNINLVLLFLNYHQEYMNW